MPLNENLHVINAILGWVGLAIFVINLFYLAWIIIYRLEYVNKKKTYDIWGYITNGAISTIMVMVVTGYVDFHPSQCWEVLTLYKVPKKYRNNKELFYNEVLEKRGIKEDDIKVKQKLDKGELDKIYLIAPGLEKK